MIWFWLAGYMFTMSLVVDDDDPWWACLVLLVAWPSVLGVAMRKRLDKNRMVEIL